MDKRGWGAARRHEEVHDEPKDVVDQLSVRTLARVEHHAAVRPHVGRPAPAAAAASAGTRRRRRAAGAGEAVRADDRRPGPRGEARRPPACVEIKFRTLHAIDATSSP